MNMTKKISQTNEIFRIAIAQLNPIVGDIEGNLAKARAARAKAADKQADLIIFPPCFISGQPLHGLALSESFITKCHWAIGELMHDTDDGKLSVLLSSIPRDFDGHYASTYNCILDNGQICPSSSAGIFDTRGLGVGFFGYWTEHSWKKRLRKAQFIINDWCYPYHRLESEKRLEAARYYMAQSGQPFVHINLFGGQDGLAFDGFHLT